MLHLSSFNHSVINLGGASLALILLLSPAAAGQQKRFSSRYVKPKAEGLFYIERAGVWNLDALVLSSDDKPIPPKSNDPDAPTIPGCYLTGTTKRLSFERVEIIGKKVYFKTRTLRDMSYEFRGVIGSEIIPDFSDTVRVPFIKGKLVERKKGKIVKARRVKFGHAVIA